MEDFNSPKKIIEFAINSEQEAYEFYFDLAKTVKSSEMHNTLMQFAKEELNHKTRLQEVIVLTDKSEGIKNKEVADLKMADYLVDKKPSPGMSYQDVLIIAMKKEKKAYKLYNDLASRVEDENLKNIFYNLAQEEAKHKLRFELEYDEHIMKEN